MQIKTTSGSGAAGLGIVGTGLALALPDIKWIGWLLVAAGLFVFLFDVRIERGHVAVGSPQSLRQRLKRMWPQYLMGLSGVLFLVGLVGFLQLNVDPPTPSKNIEPNSNSGPLAGLTNSQLRERARTFAQGLRRFEDERGATNSRLDDECRNKLPKISDQAERTKQWSICSDDMIRRRNEFRSEYMTNYRSEAVLIREELTRRLDNLPMPPTTHPFGEAQISMAREAFEGGNLAGMNPLGAAADLIEYWAARLP